MQGFFEYVREVWLSSLPMKLAYAILAAGAFELLHVLSARAIRRALAPALRADASREPTERVRRRRIVQGVPLAISRTVWYAVGLLMILRIFGLPTSAEVIPAIVLLAIAALIVAKGVLRDCMRGWLINYEDLYVPGDRVTIGEHRGTVTDLSLRTTTLRTRDGREMVIRNSRIDEVSNDSREEEGA